MLGPVNELLARADDCAVAAHSLEDTQRIISCFSDDAACSGLRINIKKMNY